MPEPNRNFSSLLLICTVCKNFLYCIYNGRSVCLDKLYAGTKLVNALCNTPLFRSLRQHNKRNTKKQAFADTVHSTMRHKDICLLKNGNLIDLRENRYVFRQLPKRLNRYEITNRHDHLMVCVCQSRQTSFI